MDAVIPEGWAWNQAELETSSEFHGVLVSLVAFTPQREPIVAGTAFALDAMDDKVGVFCTAAHVVEYLRAVQHAPPAHHASTPPEFRPPPEPLRLDRERLRALLFDGRQVNVPVVDWLIWDEHADIAFLGLKDQKPEAARVVQGGCRLTSERPMVGTRVAILGYDDTEVVDSERDGTGFERFSVARRLVLRAGTVLRLHPNGHALCRGPCFETTIPISPGMSGSPVVLLGQSGEPLSVIGVVSTSASIGEATLDRRISGDSIIAYIAPDVEKGDGSLYSARFTLTSPKYLIPPSAIKTNGTS